jgi:uncharacterized protein YgbK (DUF1537 family)
MKAYFIADDLSGALDAAAAFHHAGRRVKIVLDHADWHADADEVVGVTTETRNAAPERAAAVVAGTMARGQSQGAALVYKKIDSTLRGPVAAEIAALAQQLPGARILFTPANPAVGRTVRGEVLLVHGVPVSETEFARDPVSPVRESNLRRLLAGAGGDRVVIVDAASEADLAAAVARHLQPDEAWVAVGSGALARPVAALAAHRRGSTSPAEHRPSPAGPILMLGGSAHPGNRLQAATLFRERGVPVHVLQVAEPAAAVAAVIASLRATGGASLLVEETRHASARVLPVLTAVAREIIAATATGRIFATGGETAFALCGALEISTLRFVAELEPGLSLSRTVPPRPPVLLAIKPGGFGTAATWVRAWDHLRA